MFGQAGQLEAEFIIVQEIAFQQLLIPRKQEMRIIETDGIGGPFEQGRLCLIKYSGNTRFFCRKSLCKDMFSRCRNLIQPNLQTATITLNAQMMVHTPTEIFRQGIGFLIFFTADKCTQVPTPVLGIQTYIGTVIRILPPGNDAGSTLGLDSRLEQVSHGRLYLLQHTERSCLAFTRKGRHRRFGMITCRAGTGDTIHKQRLVEELDTVDILSPMLVVLVCHINQPPFKSVGAPQNIGLAGSHQNIVGNAVFHIEQRNVEELRTSLVCFYGKQIRAFLQSSTQLLVQVHDTIITPLLLVDKCSVQINSGISVVSDTQCQIAGFATGRESLSQP